MRFITINHNSHETTIKSKSERSQSRISTFQGGATDCHTRGKI